MTCPACNGELETSPNGAYARCKQCAKLYMTHGGTLRPVDIPAGTDPAMFAAGVGFPSAGGQQGGFVMPPDPMTATKNAFKERASNVGVRVKVGGVSMDLDKGGMSVDTSKLQKNIERKVDQKISQWIWGCVFTVFFFGVVAALLLVLGGYITYQVASSGSGGGAGAATAASWDGRSTYTCHGNETLSGVTADLGDQVAIEALGNCNLTLEDMDIRGSVGVQAGGNATVNIVGGHIKGTENSITAAGNAKVHVSGATIEGPQEASANGKIDGI
jgi:hypothetical protein